MTGIRGTAAAQRRSHRVRKLGTGFGYALGLPFLLLVVWGIWSSVAPAKFFPGPIAIFTAFIET